MHVVSKFSACACLLTKASTDLTQVMSDGFRSRIGSILTSLFNGWEPLQTLCMYPVHKGLCPPPMSSTPAACHSVFKRLIIGAVSSVCKLLRGFMMYFSRPAPDCRQNWTADTLFPIQASLVISRALNLGILVCCIAWIPGPKQDADIMPMPWKVAWPSTVLTLRSTLSATNWVKQALATSFRCHRSEDVMTDCR